MNEEQRELTEEELMDGIPVDAPEGEETEPKEAPPAPPESAVVELTREETTALPAIMDTPNPIERPVMTLDPQRLVDWGYVVMVPFAGKRQAVLTVDGICHVAATMGVQLLSCEVVDEGDWLYGNAEAFDPSTGARWFGKVRQATKFKNGKEDPQAWEKCATRAQRNALKRLIPYQRLVNKCEQLLNTR